MGQPLHCGEYPATWTAIARAVKDAAEWRCVRCRREHAPAIGYCLTVHHFDGNKGNVADWNLMALCQRCHLSVQARVNPAVPLLFRPSLWIMPHLAGMYEAGAHSYPSAAYDLAKWIELYEAGWGEWPTWAPVPAPPKF